MHSEQSANRWSSNLMFLAAAVGSSVGISNIWKFTYVAGANGGGAFVIVYLMAVTFIAFPALIAEFLIGRRGGRSVVGTMKVLADRDGISPSWRFYGYLAILGVFLALSFYMVIAGWTIDYFITTLKGSFQNVDGTGAGRLFGELVGNPARIIASQATFIILSVITVAYGIHRGLERILKWLTPALFIILLALLGYAVMEADFAAGVAFLLKPDFSKITMTTVLMAIGQAFFSLGVGVGVLMTIGAYMDRKSSIVQGAIVVSIADVTAAMCAGLAIFPIVFAFGLSPAEGPGLVFVTLPIAFGQMMVGPYLGGLFFLLMAVAAFTSSVTLIETIVAWLLEATGWSRPRLAALTGFALWFVGLATVFSFNIWSDFYPLGFWQPAADKTVFDLLDYLVSNLIMPLGGILLGLLAGWALSREAVMDELGIGDSRFFKCWLFFTRYLVPVAISFVFLFNLA